ncbi:hypothetical protein DCAR_0101897 [Daucus carota subsp. sativus]|uniref:Alpha/beta hydrolase fold-3 domain-containing protein n=1 Tax=Daucus carota subsp. sativus TaxID=79200 RepID=A0AAF0W434_DAUCS|nr:PREDICTED: probable carboxylesterase 7 [Daucus carota subsp. sativus]WOG82729.1 hypothetical protein DCAR_0101897 [Daucus carota subsp. sativus]
MAELDYELPRFIRVYKDGTVERLMGTDTVPAGIDPETGVESKDVLVTPESGVSARLYLPKIRDPAKKLPLVIYFHGGGFYCFTPFSTFYQPFLNSFVAESNIILISIDYRRPPEHPVPVAYDDSWNAIRWVASHCNGTGPEAWLSEYADFGRVHISGDSAGANIAHCMAMRAGSEKVNGLDFDGLILMHPYFWGKDPVGGETDDTEKRAYIEKFWVLACPTSSGADDPWMNPGLDPKLSSLVCKRALVFGTEDDFLKYRAKYYGEVLGKSGWAGKVEVVETEGEAHVFHLYKPKIKKSMELVHKVMSFIYEENANPI